MMFFRCRRAYLIYQSRDKRVLPTSPTVTIWTLPLFDSDGAKVVGWLTVWNLETYWLYCQTENMFVHAYIHTSVLTSFFSYHLGVKTRLMFHQLTALDSRLPWRNVKHWCAGIFICNCGGRSRNEQMQCAMSKVWECFVCDISVV